MAMPQATPRAKTILNDYSQPHPETEKPVEGAKRNGQLRFEQKANGKIVLRVYDNVWNENAKPVTREAELNYSERGAIFDAVRQAAEKNTDFASLIIPVNQRQWMRTNGINKLSDEPINVCNFIITRREDGRISLTYQKADFKFETVFRLANVDAFKKRTKTGEIIEDRGAPSQASARSWCTFHEPTLNDMEKAAWKPKENKNNNNFQNNNNGGGNNNGGWQKTNTGGNGGNGAAVEESFEEIDW